MYLRGKYPFKHNSEIKEMLAAKTTSHIFEEECVDIIKYMYNQEDSELILEKMRKLSSSKSDKYSLSINFSL